MLLVDRGALAAALSHAHAEVVKVVGDVELPWGPLVSAGLVFTDSGAAAVNVAHSILVFLLADMPEVEQGATAWVVDDHVLQVSDTPEVGHLGADKGRECLITNTG